MASAVEAMLRSADAQHITPQTIAAISARPAVSTVIMPGVEAAASARMNATAPAHIAKAIARLLSENPSTALALPPSNPSPDRQMPASIPGHIAERS